MIVPLLDLGRRIEKHRSRIDSAIERVLNNGNFILGLEVENFETLFAAFIGVQHCVGVANGTDALELALRAVNVQSGDKVATVANAGYYTTTALNSIGAIPFYMDVDAATKNVTLEEVKRAVANGVSIVVVTHLYGLAIGEIREIANFCRNSFVRLIEDCAQSHGAQLHGQKVGSFGDVAAFSFYPTKNLGALGDAGAVMTRNQDIAAAVKKLRAYGWSSKYSVTLPGGRNSRLDEIQAAILSELLPFLEVENARRRDIAAMYTSKIESDDIQVPRIGSEDFVSHLFVVSSTNRSAYMAQLLQAGIGTAVHYPIPDHRQPVAKDKSCSLPVSEQLAEQVFTLPCYPEMTDKEVQKVVAALNNI